MLPEVGVLAAASEVTKIDEDYYTKLRFSTEIYMQMCLFPALGGMNFFKNMNTEEIS